MVKDYFEDIVPPDRAPQRRASKQPAPRPHREEKPVEIEEDGDDLPPVSEKSIRNIDAPQRAARSHRAPVTDTRDPASFGVPVLPPKPIRHTSRAWVWVLAAVLVVLVVVFALFALRKTTVTVTPRSHTIVFDQTSQYTAFPAADAATGTLSYTVLSSDLQDSEVVPAQGTQHVEQKAQGTITVFNDYSKKPIKLIANTRFATESGLIFRTPADVVVPGKVGTVPGKIAVTVFADQPGAQYNIGPTPRFTVPGLQSSPAMYANVYAQSSASTTGGFLGDEPSADPTAVSNAQTDIEAKLVAQAKAAALAANGTTTIAFPDLTQITFQNLAPTTEAGGGARIGVSAHIEIPVFDSQSLTQAIAQNVAADAQGDSLTLVPGSGFSASQVNATSTTLGQDPIVFALSGTATLLWQVDPNALAQALAGKDQTAFNMIASGIPGVQEAHARIEPFWKTSFPSNPSDIQVVIQTPVSSQ